RYVDCGYGDSGDTGDRAGGAGYSATRLHGDRWRQLGVVATCRRGVASDQGLLCRARRRCRRCRHGIDHEVFSVAVQEVVMLHQDGQKLVTLIFLAKVPRSNSLQVARLEAMPAVSVQPVKKILCLTQEVVWCRRVAEA